jgi:hypothetical protein
MDMAMKSGDEVAKEHISNMEGCGMKDMQVTEVKKGQSWTTTGYYDYNQRTPNRIKSLKTKTLAPGEVMAISIVLVAVKPG